MVKEVESLQETFVIHAIEPANPRYFVGKRCIDVSLAALLLVLLSPLMLLIALVIKLETSGPALFVQQRVGSRHRSRDRNVHWEVRPFGIYKFRTMVRDADPSLHQSFAQDFVRGRGSALGGSSLPSKLTNDPRVTRFGRILRKTSLDELPQLINVLKGEMSLVGPRPVPLYEVAAYDLYHGERLAALPGMTGLWQVVGRGRSSFDEMMQLDITYVRARSLWLDLKILILTIPAVLLCRGAQ